MKSTLRMLFASVVVIGSSTAYAGWTDDWITSKTQSGPSTFEGQKRNYWSGGTYNARFGFTTEHVVSFTPPSISGGCGGINVYGGNLSYMEPEYLVQKLQNIVQAAPAAAFDIAMKTMCQVCSDTMKTLESLSNALNGMQFNECQAAKKIMVTAKDAATEGKLNSDALMDTVGGAAAWSEVSANFEHFKESVKTATGKSPIATNTLTANCPTDFKDIFTSGSIVNNAATKLGLNGYSDLLRGLIGDADVTFVEADNGYRVTPIDRCPQNNDPKTRLNDFMNGRVHVRRADGTCAPESNTDTVVSYIDTQLTNIATKFTTPTAEFTVDETLFIQNAPLPVFRIMRTAVMTQTVEMTIGMLREPIARAEAYRLMDSLYMRINRVIDLAIQSTKPPSLKNVLDKKVCDPTVLTDAINKVMQMKAEADTLREAAREEYLASLKELTAMQQFASWQEAQDKKALREAVSGVVSKH